MELPINPLFNVQEVEKMGMIINPYRFASGTTLKTGLVGCWEFDEPSGTTSNDSYATNNGTISGATVNQTGKINKCYDFDGSDDYVLLPMTSHYPNFSFSCWFYARGGGENNSGRLFDKRESGQSDVLALLIQGSITSIGFYAAWSGASGYGSWTTANGTTQFNRWYHIVVTYNSESELNDPIIYINGVSKSLTEPITPSGSVVTTSSKYLIGNRGATDRAFVGLIDQVAIWNKILTPTEVGLLYNSGNGLAYTSW